MTNRARSGGKPDDATASAEHPVPSEGGSYVRNADGSLSRVAFTDHADTATDSNGAAADAAPDAPSQEG